MRVWGAIVGECPSRFFVEVGEGDGEEVIGVRTFPWWFRHREIGCVHINWVWVYD